VEIAQRRPVLDIDQQAQATGQDGKVGGRRLVQIGHQQQALGAEVGRGRQPPPQPVAGGQHQVGRWIVGEDRDGEAALVELSQAAHRLVAVADQGDRHRLGAQGDRQHQSALPPGSRVASFSTPWRWQ
jgi:hypothetical protein